MAHWFDRAAVATTGVGDGFSRRTVFKGAAVTALASSPLASPMWARLGIAMEARAESEGCRACVVGTINAHNVVMRSCDKTGSMWGTPPSGKKKGKAAPVSAAKRMACAMKERAEFAHDLNFCRIDPCRGEAVQPLVVETDPAKQPFPTKPGDSACPGGTTRCTNEICCFGGDLCCPCKNSDSGFICCVAAVGCSCCG